MNPALANRHALIEPARAAPRWAMRALAATLTVLVAACSSAGTNRDHAAAERLAQEAGCTGCHGADFSGGVGPSWHNLYGSTVKLDDGTTVVVDRAYLVESIINPDAKRRLGATSVMPTPRLSPSEVDQLVDFIIALSDAPGS